MKTGVVMAAAPLRAFAREVRADSIDWRIALGGEIVKHGSARFSQVSLDHGYDGCASEVRFPAWTLCFTHRAAG